MKSHNCFILVTIVATFFYIVLWTACEQRDFEKVICVTTDSTANIETTKATIYSHIIDLGRNNMVVTYGHCWSTQSAPTINNDTTAFTNAYENITYESIITGLSYNTTYYIRAYVSDGETVEYSEEITIVTAGLGTPEVSALTVEDIGITTVVLNGLIDDVGDMGAGVLSVDSYGFCWSTEETPTITNDYTDLGSSDTNIPFEQMITYLEPNTTYYVRIWAENENGISYSEVVSFTTNDIDAPGSIVYVSGVEENDIYTFYMGIENFTDSSPVHIVTLNDFSIGKYEITNQQFANFLNAYGTDTVRMGDYQGEALMYDPASYDSFTGGVSENKEGEFEPQSGYESYPAIYITWYGAYEFCCFYGCRLPTEAEWEYAATGGQSSNGYTFSGSDDPDDVAWYGENPSSGSSHSIGLKSANEIGTYDMTGNAVEWCSDWYNDSYYSESPTDNPTGPDTGNNKVIRGGSWDNSETYLYAAFRLSKNPQQSNNKTGFRLAIDVSED